MKRINITFRSNEAKEDIDVVITASEKDQQVLSLMHRLHDPMSEKITAYDPSGSAVTIHEKDIISISVDNKKLKIVTETGLFELTKRLKDIEKILHPTLFLRISRYEIINIDKVKRFDFPISGTLQIEMVNGMTTWASRRFISEIKNRFKERG
jgi:DNA-binding LytR/AlgR family response regulator